MYKGSNKFSKTQYMILTQMYLTEKSIIAMDFRCTTLYKVISFYLSNVFQKNNIY